MDFLSKAFNIGGLREGVGPALKLAQGAFKGMGAASALGQKKLAQGFQGVGTGSLKQAGQELFNWATAKGAKTTAQRWGYGAARTGGTVLAANMAINTISGISGAALGNLTSNPLPHPITSFKRGLD